VKLTFCEDSFVASSIKWAGQQFELFSARAVFWREAKTLIIADAHFGKAAAFRNRGVPVPAGTTQADVDRLATLIHDTCSTRLIILGDFLHARDGRADSTMAILSAWRQQHAALEIVLVRGNHDQHAGDPPAEWNFRCVNEPFIEDQFAFFHDPAKQESNSSRANAARGFADSEPYSFAGHIHPCAVLHDTDGSVLRAACFFFGKRQAILPAFGCFTGTHPIRPRRGERIFAIGPDDSVIEVRAAEHAER